MRRREFIALIGNAAITWPLTAGAQQSDVSRIGFLRNTSPDARLVAALLSGLRANGYVDGRNLAIEYRWAEDRYERLPQLAAELVASQVAVIIAAGQPAALACKAATSTVPVVFATGEDPVRIGLVASLNRPGGNMTGVSFLIDALGEKTVNLLHQLLPTAVTIAALVNPKNPQTESNLRDLQNANRLLGLQMQIHSVTTPSEIETAFARMSEQQVSGLIVSPDSLFLGHSDQVVKLAAKYRLPAIYPLRQYADAGGLLSYGTSISDAYRLAGIYAARILRGDKPADLPVQQSTKFELVVNLKTAKTLGISIPPGVLALADEVIE